MKAYTTKRIDACGDHGLPQETVTWRSITITGYDKAKKIVRAVTERNPIKSENGLTLDIPLRFVFKDKLRSIVRPKDLKSLKRVTY